jgi:hypothetical protein
LGFDKVDELNFEKFTCWGAVSSYRTKYKEKKFFDRIEEEKA